MMDPEVLADAIATAIKAALFPHVTEIAHLKKRIAELEGKPHVTFTGIYADTKAYTPGDAATRSGGLWICVNDTTGPFDHAAWQLAVKKGDAR